MNELNSATKKSNQYESRDIAADHSANMIILYFTFSLCLGYLIETIVTKSYVYPIKIFIELAALLGLTFAQEKVMSNARFYYRKLAAINLTVWLFGKILFYSIDTLREGSKTYHGYALFMIFQIIYHSGFLINHSWAYGIAQLACHSEFWIEAYLFPSLKEKPSIIFVGALITAVGHIFRLGAFISARSNFTHLIQMEKRSTHQLITTGIYRFSRHPSYFGWFMSTAGGQMLLLNPICFIGFTAAAWFFFYDRIMFEEYTLEKFFGRSYTEYANKTSIGIPFLQYFINRRRSKAD